MIYLFRQRGLASLTEFVTPDTLFAFDLDGTLVPITADPSGIRLSTAVREALVELKQRATLAIITGRSRKDARRHLDMDPHYLVGNHGSEGLPGWEGCEREFRRRSDQWTRQLHSLLSETPMSGVRIENKGLSVAVHFRNAADRTAAQSAVLRAIDRLTPFPRIVGGKYVENLLPEEAPDKGTALLQLMTRADCAKGLFAGDDQTDEDVFQLNRDHLFTIRVGKRKYSRADYFIRKQEEILMLLQHINIVLARRHP